jgi:hypothetical protein
VSCPNNSEAYENRRTISSMILVDGIVPIKQKIKGKKNPSKQNQEGFQN